MPKQTAQLNYVHIAPRKMRLLANTLRGLTIGEAEAQLMMSPLRSSDPLLKLLRSAIANAKNNQKLDGEALIVSEIFVNEGPMLKRFLPRAMGRATPIHKKMSHVHITLEDKPGVTSRFVIAPPVKKEGKKPKAKIVQPKTDAVKRDERSTRKSGFMNRFFQRKTI